MNIFRKTKSIDKLTSAKQDKPLELRQSSTSSLWTGSGLLTIVSPTESSFLSLQGEVSVALKDEQFQAVFPSPGGLRGQNEDSQIGRDPLCGLVVRITPQGSFTRLVDLAFIQHESKFILGRIITKKRMGLGRMAPNKEPQVDHLLVRDLSSDGWYASSKELATLRLQPTEQRQTTEFGRRTSQPPIKIKSPKNESVGSAIEPPYLSLGFPTAMSTISTPGGEKLAKVPQELAHQILERCIVQAVKKMNPPALLRPSAQSMKDHHIPLWKIQKTGHLSRTVSYQGKQKTQADVKPLIFTKTAKDSDRFLKKHIIDYSLDDVTQDTGQEMNDSCSTLHGTGLVHNISDMTGQGSEPGKIPSEEQKGVLHDRNSELMEGQVAPKVVSQGTQTYDPVTSVIQLKPFEVLRQRPQVTDQGTETSPQTPIAKIKKPSRKLVASKKTQKGDPLDRLAKPTAQPAIYLHTGPPLPGVGSPEDSHDSSDKEMPQTISSQESSPRTLNSRSPSTPSSGVPQTQSHMAPTNSTLQKALRAIFEGKQPSNMTQIPAQSQQTTSIQPIHFTPIPSHLPPPTIPELSQEESSPADNPLLHVQASPPSFRCQPTPELAFHPQPDEPFSNPLSVLPSHPVHPVRTNPTPRHPLPGGADIGQLMIYARLLHFDEHSIKVLSLNQEGHLLGCVQTTMVRDIVDPTLASLWTMLENSGVTSLKARAVCLSRADPKKMYDNLRAFCELQNNKNDKPN